MLAPAFMFEKYPQIIVRMANILTYFTSEWATSILNFIGLYKLRYTFFQFKNMDELFSNFSFLYDENIQIDTPRQVKLLNELSIPGFILFGSNEKIISLKSISTLHELLQLNDKIIYIQEDNPALLPKIQSIDKISSYLLNSESHFPHSSFPKVTNRLIEQYMEL